MIDVLNLSVWDIRGTDSNSLLRMHDLASAVRNNSGSREQRTRAEKTMQRIVKELKARNIEPGVTT